MGFYNISIKEEFAAAHFIPGYNGDCARLHGHNWKVEVSVQATKVNEIGISLDFKDLKRVVKELIQRYDHQNLNEIKPFDEISPTAENVSCWFYQEIKTRLQSLYKDVKLMSVSIHETDRSFVAYSEH